MPKLFLKPKQADDLTRHLSLFSVGDESAWVGHGQNMLYMPYSETEFGASDESAVILVRSAFSIERSIVGRRMIIPEGRLGQVAVLSQTASDQNEELTAAIVIPFKVNWLGKVNQAISYIPLPSRGEVAEDLTKPSAFMHRTVRNALYELINAEPAQLTQTGE